VATQRQSAKAMECPGNPRHRNSLLPDCSDRMPVPYCLHHRRTGNGRTRRADRAERRGVKRNLSTMYQPIELMGSLWEPETKARMGERCRLVADCGLGEMFAAERSARDGNSSSEVPACAVPGAVIEVRWSRDMFWSNKIAVSESR